MFTLDRVDQDRRREARLDLDLDLGVEAQLPGPKNVDAARSLASAASLAGGPSSTCRTVMSSRRASIVTNSRSSATTRAISVVAVTVRKVTRASSRFNGHSTVPSPRTK